MGENGPHSFPSKYLCRSDPAGSGYQPAGDVIIPMCLNTGHYSPPGKVLSTNQGRRFLTSSTPSRKVGTGACARQFASLAVRCRDMSMKLYGYRRDPVVRARLMSRRGTNTTVPSPPRRTHHAGRACTRSAQNAERRSLSRSSGRPSRG